MHFVFLIFVTPLTLIPSPQSLPLIHISPSFSVSVGVKSAYSPAPSTVFSQPPPPQRQVTALKPIVPSSSVSTSYNIYPVSSSVQQPSTPISSYTLDSSFGSSGSVTTYSGKTGHNIKFSLIIDNSGLSNFHYTALF